MDKKIKLTMEQAALCRFAVLMAAERVMDAWGGEAYEEIMDILTKEIR